MLNAFSIFNVIGLIGIITIIIFNIYRNDLYNLLELFYASDSILPYVFSIIISYISIILQHSRLGITM